MKYIIILITTYCLLVACNHEQVVKVDGPSNEFGECEEPLKKRPERLGLYWDEMDSTQQTAMLNAAHPVVKDFYFEFQEMTYEDGIYEFAPDDVIYQLGFKSGDSTLPLYAYFLNELMINDQHEGYLQGYVYNESNIGNNTGYVAEPAYAMFVDHTEYVVYLNFNRGITHPFEGVVAGWLLMIPPMNDGDAFEVKGAVMDNNSENACEEDYVNEFFYNVNDIILETRIDAGLYR